MIASNNEKMLPQKRSHPYSSVTTQTLLTLDENCPEQKTQARDHHLDIGKMVDDFHYEIVIINVSESQTMDLGYCLNVTSPTHHGKK